jgi:acyl-CoA reductase-like NAD-dependent aldehyde dehydrogenase
MLSATKGAVVIGGEKDKDTRFIGPTAVVDVKATDSLMKEEVCLGIYILLEYCFPSFHYCFIVSNYFIFIN